MSGRNGGSAGCTFPGCHHRRSRSVPYCSFHLEHAGELPPVESIERKSARATHVIADVHYTRGGRSDEAPLTCSCGWSGIAGDYLAHRRGVGAPEGVSA